jgi:hypothetical protein
MVASKLGKKDVVEKLIGKGADVNYQMKEVMWHKSG